MLAVTGVNDVSKCLINDLKWDWRGSVLETAPNFVFNGVNNQICRIMVVFR